MSPEQLREKAVQIRIQSLETAVRAGKGHVPPAFSWTEIAVALYYGGVLRHDAANPSWSERDRFILSKGHACLTLYAILADRGYFPVRELEHFAGPGAMLAGHPDAGIPGIETVSGSLGHGLGVGSGLALGCKMDRCDWVVFVLLGDGECDEGSVWEAAMFAAHHHLDNLVAIVDRNTLSATDFTESVLALEPLAQRWSSFGWDVSMVNGHSFDELLPALSGARGRRQQKPHLIIANTVKGNGVGFMENSPDWHHRLPKGEAVAQALQELKSGRGKGQP